MSEFTETIRNLSWLDDHDALTGVAELVRERRRQIERGFTPAHDREHHADGYLVTEADSRTTAAIVTTAQGLSGPAEVERYMAEAGALAAAEIDRLTAEFSPSPS